MQQHFINNNSQDLIVFFSGWGCDEHQFANLKDKKLDVLIFFDYQDLSYEFNFDKYNNIYVLSYSAGGMISCILDSQIPNIKKRVTVNSNPYLFDEKLGVPPYILEVFKGITMDNYLEFRKKYMVEGEDEFVLYNKYSSQRTLESCQEEYLSLLDIYGDYREELKPNFDKAIFSDSDEIFDFSTQKEFYKDKLIIIPNSKHHLFFKFNSFEDML